MHGGEGGEKRKTVSDRKEKKLREKETQNRGGRRETEPGKFWSLNQQQILVLLPPSSSS
jgi:hypothetical protein